jgi:hypothetical protein
MCGPCGGNSGDGGIPGGGDGGNPGDGGTPTGGNDGGCSLYGQLCTSSANCCNGVPCTSGRCQVALQ